MSAARGSDDQPVRALAATDPVLARLIDRIGPCTLQPKGESDLFQALLRSIIFQQLHADTRELIPAVSDTIPNPFFHFVVVWPHLSVRWRLGPLRANLFEDPTIEQTPPGHPAEFSFTNSPLAAGPEFLLSRSDARCPRGRSVQSD